MIVILIMSSNTEAVIYFTTPALLCNNRWTTILIRLILVSRPNLVLQDPVLFASASCVVAGDVWNSPK